MRCDVAGHVALDDDDRGWHPARSARARRREFSFLLGVPTFGAACAYKLLKNFLMSAQTGTPNLFEQLGAGPVGLGFAVAAVSAAIAVRWLVAFLQHHGLAPFGWYRIALSLVLGALAFSGAVSLDG